LSINENLPGIGRAWATGGEYTAAGSPLHNAAAPGVGPRRKRPEPMGESDGIFVGLDI